MSASASPEGRGLLVDLDDTLYDYAPAERAAKQAILPDVARSLGFSEDEALRRWNDARRAVKARTGSTGSSHSRLLYLTELVHAAGGVSALASVRRWERTFWGAFIEAATLRPHALALLQGWRSRGGKVAIVTDLTLEVQLWKLEAFGLFTHVDALAVSEEVHRNKPERAIFELAAARLGLPLERCVMIGDSPLRDGGGATAVGIPFHLAQSSEHPDNGGKTLELIAQELGVLS